jgi:hypothetical protein
MWSLLQEKCDPFRDPTYSDGHRTAIRCLGSCFWGRAVPGALTRQAALSMHLSGADDARSGPELAIAIA